MSYLLKSGPLRRFVWRAGRHIYCYARGETQNDIVINGEAYVQASVIKGTRTMKERLVALDVGAHLGEWTRSFLQQLSDSRAKNTRVMLFEPIPIINKQLRKNLAVMPRHGITEVFELAISDCVGSAEMVVLSDSGGTDSLEFDKQMYSMAMKIISVQKSTIDKFCSMEVIERIHLLKCDTEGHDFHVLKGGIEFLRGGRIDVVQFEYNHRWVLARAFLKDVFDLVDKLPYRVARLCPSHIEVFEAWHPELERFFEGNYLLVHESALHWFDTRRGNFDVSNTYA